MRYAPNDLDSGGGGSVAAPTPAPRHRRGALVMVAVVAGLFIAALALWWLRPPAGPGRVEAQARAYVTLALNLRRIDPDAVDFYFGPATLEPPADRPAPTLAIIRTDAGRLLDDIGASGGEALPARRAKLAGKVRQLILLIDMMQATAPLSFDDEARRLYGVEVGTIDDRPRQAALARLAVLLPGPGALADRVAAFRARLAVPAAQREAVFTRALAECRRRTAAHWPLPRGERVEVRWSGDAPAAWHRYRGGGVSDLDVNPQAVGFVGAAIDLACHEAYPGHHAQFLAMEAAAGQDGLSIEDRVVLNRSPDAVLREGAANYGVRLAFPLADRIAFARDVLYPLAGFPPAQAATDMQVHQLLGELELAVVPTLRAYRDGLLTLEVAAARLRTEALISSPEALLGFVDQHGALVVGYTIARDRVAAQVAARGARDHRDAWAELRAIVAAPDLSALAPVLPRS